MWITNLTLLNRMIPCLLLFTSLNSVADDDYTSKVPKYVFADTLEEQETQLAENPLLERFEVSRAKAKADPYYPRYHFTSPENRINDPNGLCFWKGNWHLFYQGYPPEDSRQHWGHAVSDDLIHWRDLPYAIYPNPEYACFSGSTLVEEDRVIAMYYGVKAGSMIAVSDDPLLLNWEKLTGQAVIPFPNPDPRTPYIQDSCIWKNGNSYYALTSGLLYTGPGGKGIRAEHLHRSEDLTTWTYLHPFLENDLYGTVGDDGACPYFWPIGDQYILLHYSHINGGKYLIGDYDTERNKFAVTDGGDFNFGANSPCGVHAPSATPDGEGGVITIFNINNGKPNNYGWMQLMSLPMRLSLAPIDEIDSLHIEPAENFESLRQDHVRMENVQLPANKEIVLDGISGNSMELYAEIDCPLGGVMELNVLRSENSEEVTRIMFFAEKGYAQHQYKTSDPRYKLRSSVLSIDTSRSTMLSYIQSRPPENSQFYKARDERLKLHVFIDKSVVEVFANGKRYTAVRVYPGREDSIGVSLRSQGSSATLESIDCWQMKSIYE